MHGHLLSEQQLAALGRVAIASADLEFILNWMIAVVLKLPVEAHEAIVTPMSLSTKLEVFIKVGMPRIAGKKRKKEFSELGSHLKGLVVKRNIVIHGSWTLAGKVSLGDQFLLKATDIPARKDLYIEARNKNRAFNAENLQQLANELSAGQTQIWKIARGNWMRVKSPGKA